MPIAVQQIAGLNQSSRTQQKKSTENRSRSMNQKRLRWKPEEKQMKKWSYQWLVEEFKRKIHHWWEMEH